MMLVFIKILVSVRYDDDDDDDDDDDEEEEDEDDDDKAKVNNCGHNIVIRNFRYN
jgi:hypothetical protein